MSIDWVLGSVDVIHGEKKNYGSRDFVVATCTSTSLPSFLLAWLPQCRLPILVDDRATLRVPLYTKARAE